VLADSPVNPGAFGFDEWFSSPNFFDNNPILSREGKSIETHGEGSMVTVEAALEFIRKHANGPNPFLAVIWFGSPHRPHEAEEYDCALYPNQSKNFQHFYGEITAMDRAFGKLRKELRNMSIEKNTLLWYCSDNGGLEGLSRTGGRGHKSNIYEGGLRVPAFLEWPSQIPSPKKSGLSCSTSDFFPTILDILGIEMENQLPLDGISLYPLIKNGLDRRSKPIGFWDYPANGISTPSHKLMTELLKAQMQGKKIDDPSRLRLDAGEIKKQYPVDSFPGHSAWLDWPWKLHRIQEDSGLVEWELYNLEQDPMEQSYVKLNFPDKLNVLQNSLEVWLVSVVRSLNGKDY
jgi:arylsulfatase A-like enzyme